MLPPVPGTEARWRPGSADPTTPEVSQAPGLREFRLAESQQILPRTGNRKPASDRTHWLQPAPCSSRRRSCPGGERGDRQSSVPADSTPSRAQPTGRRIDGYDYKTEAIQGPRADNHAHSREMTKAIFSRAGLAGTWTTRVQARRAPVYLNDAPTPETCPRPLPDALPCAMLVQAQVVPWWGTGRPAEFSPSGFHPSRASPTGRRIVFFLMKRRPTRSTLFPYPTLSRSMRNSNFLVPPPLGVGVFGKLPAARKRKDRQRNRLGRSQHAPACPRNRKPAGDGARQNQPPPSRSGRHLDYKRSGSPRPSRSHRPEAT